MERLAFPFATPPAPHPPGGGQPFGGSIVGYPGVRAAGGRRDP